MQNENAKKTSGEWESAKTKNQRGGRSTRRTIAISHFSNFEEIGQQPSWVVNTFSHEWTEIRLAFAKSENGFIFIYSMFWTKNTNY